MNEPAHTASRLKVLVVGDDPVLRRGIAQYLSLIFPSVMVEEASSALEGLLIFGAEAWGLIVLDLPATGELAPLIQLKLAIPDVPVLVLYADPATTDSAAVFAAGAAGYLGKAGPASEWTAAIETVVKGGSYPDV